jgi:negative regulator of sigma E activity
MNEQEQISQLSALFDGELPAQQAQMVIRRAVKDPAMREHWQRYALIGACLRGEPLAGADRDDNLADRVRTRLAAEVDIIAPGALGSARAVGSGRGAGRFFGRGAMGGAIAAAVAVVSIFVVRNMGTATGEIGVLATDTGPTLATTPVVAATDPATVRAASAVAPEPPSYTTPGANSPAANRMADQQLLAHYVVAHSEQAASAFGFSYDLTEGAEDMTEDEIKARR